MKQMPVFNSSLAKAMTDLVTFKQMEGFDYIGQAQFLKWFDDFLCSKGYRETSLNRQIVDAYIAHTGHLAPNSRYSRLSPVRVLSRFLNQLEPQSYVLGDLPVKRPSLPRWYQYTDEDVVTILRYAATLGPAGSFRPHCFRMLIGLLYVTGLRISETLALDQGDVDIGRRLLHVRKGKFGKERYVVLHRTTIDVVEEYLKRRSAHAPSGHSTPFFLHSSGNRLEYSQAADTFRRIVRQCKIGSDAPQLPRLHDLRHAYACNCVLRWYEEGVDVNTMLPVLATAMGHVNVESTQIYLHVSSRLLKQAAQRFHPTFTASCKGE